MPANDPSEVLAAYNARDDEQVAALKRSLAPWVTQADHETHVYQEGGQWFWTCPCGVRSRRGFSRRMDADDDVWTHLDQFPHS